MEDAVPTEDSKMQDSIESSGVEAVALSDDEVWFNSHPSRA